MNVASTLLSTHLPGTWELLSRVDRTAAGDVMAEPTLGSDPVALLIYDRAGHFAAQFMKRDRSVPAAGPATPVAGVNNTAAKGGYDAYFGTYTVDDARGLVTQTLQGALSAENVGMVVTRGMAIADDLLTIALGTSALDGTPVTRTLTWRRVG